MNLIFAAAEEKGNGLFFPSDINEFWWGAAAFLLVMAFLAWKVLPVARNMMSKNAEKIEGELQSAEEARTASESRTADLRAHLGDISHKREELMAEARTSATRLEADLIARAEAEAEELRRRGEAEADLIRRQAAADLQTEMGVWVSEAAEALIAESLRTDAAAQEALVDAYITSDLAASAEPVS